MRGETSESANSNSLILFRLQMKIAEMRITRLAQRLLIDCQTTRSIKARRINH